MEGGVYSAKSLLASIGTSKENNALEKDGWTAASDGKSQNKLSQESSFLLSSTLNEIEKPDIDDYEKNLPQIKDVNDENINYGNSKQLLQSPNNELSNPNISVKEASNTSRESDKKAEETEGVEVSDDESDIIIDTATNPKIESKTLELIHLLNPSHLLSSYDLLLGSFYEEHKHELINNKKLILRTITWNLNQMKTPDLASLAGPGSREWSAFFYAGDGACSESNKEGLADIYSINFQETISLTSFSKSNSAINQWCDFFVGVLNAVSSNDYKVIYKSGLLALTSIIIAKSELTADETKNYEGQIHNIKHDTLGLGYLRWANKGCISTNFRVGGISLDVGKYTSGKSSMSEFYMHSFKDLDETKGKLPGVEIQILNVHLVHGEEETQIKQRWDSWAKIERVIGLVDRSVSLVSNDTPVSDESQKRLQAKLKNKLNSKDISDTESIDDALTELNIEDNSIRTAYVPLEFDESENKRFDSSNIVLSDLKKFKKVTEAKKAVVVCGDTNYRLSLPYDSTLNSKNTIKNLIRNANWGSLLEHDQFLKEYNSKKVFIGFTEDKIAFAPTFKVLNDSVGTWVDQNKTSESSDPYFVPQYDTKRLPAYTDRILYTPRSYLNAIEGTYMSGCNTGSDHLPVSISYELDAPIVNESILHQLRNKFNEEWDIVLNKLVFMKLSQIFEVKHIMLSKYKEDYSNKLSDSVVESISTKNGNISCSCITGESLDITIDIENIIEEPINLIVTEQTNRGWFGTKIAVACCQAGDEELSEVNSDNVISSTCKINPKNQGKITFKLTPTTAGILERVFVCEIPAFKLCPAYQKYVALTIDVRDIFSESFEDISEKQFMNIQECFEFVYKAKTQELLSRMEDLGSSNDFTRSEWDLVREVTLWEFHPEKYESMNNKSIELIKSGQNGQFNIGSVTVMSFLYVWLKSQGSYFNIKTERGKSIFGNVIKLINFFKMDASKAFYWFGWLFSDEYEINSYLDQDFAVKVTM